MNSLSQSKVVYIPKKIDVEENTVQSTTIRNMSKIDIYRCFPIYAIDDFIYLSDMLSPQVIKLSSQGKVVARFGKKGQGPGESEALYCVSGFKENIAIMGKFKVIICNKDLQFIREIRLKEWFLDFIIIPNNKIYLYNNPSYSNYYFTIYTYDFKYSKKFGIKNPDAIDDKSPFRNYRYSYDQVRCTLYVPEENGIWVSFKDRYDLRYYKDEKNAVDIKSKLPVFVACEDEFMGVKTNTYIDRSILIAKNTDNLFYFYWKGDTLFCDVFNLDENYRLYRRIKFPFPYMRLIHSREFNFYGLRYDANKENVFLDKLQIKPKGGK